MSQDLFQQEQKAQKGKKTDVKKKFFTSPCFLGSGIRDPGSGMGKNPDPGSGINIPDPQHCLYLLPMKHCSVLFVFFNFFFAFHLGSPHSPSYLYFMDIADIQLPCQSKKPNSLLHLPPRKNVFANIYFSRPFLLFAFIFAPFVYILPSIFSNFP